jgi:hypothetical protein
VGSRPWCGSAVNGLPDRVYEPFRTWCAWAAGTQRGAVTGVGTAYTAQLTDRADVQGAGEEEEEEKEEEEPTADGQGDPGQVPQAGGGGVGQEAPLGRRGHPAL